MALTCLQLQASRHHGSSSLPSGVLSAANGGSSTSISAGSRGPRLGTGMAGSVSEPPAIAALRRGEFRVVMNLERVLEQGPQCKQVVDVVVDELYPVGALRDDIVEYKLAAERLQVESRETTETNDLQGGMVELGVKALRRYCFLIIFQAYLIVHQRQEGTSSRKVVQFSSWMEGMPEIEHLVKKLALE